MTHGWNWLDANQEFWSLCFIKNAHRQVLGRFGFELVQLPLVGTPATATMAGFTLRRPPEIVPVTSAAARKNVTPAAAAAKTTLSALSGAV